MKMKKIITVVLTLVISLGMSSNYFVAKKNLNNFSTAMIIEDKKNNNINKEINTTKLAKDETNIRNSSKVTSRNGIRKPLENVSDVSETEEVANSTKANTSNTEKSAENTTDAPVEESTQEVVPTKPTYQGVELEYSATYHVSSSHLTKSKGVVYYNGHKETYYSQKVLSGKGLKALNNNGRHVANDGTVRDGEGYIAVACNYLSKGSKIMTSLGPGKVYDTGSMTGKWIDIYVNW